MEPDTPCSTSPVITASAQAPLLLVRLQPPAGHHLSSLPVRGRRRRRVSKRARAQPWRGSSGRGRPWHGGPDAARQAQQELQRRDRLRGERLVHRVRPQPPSWRGSSSSNRPARRCPTRSRPRSSACRPTSVAAASTSRGPDPPPVALHQPVWQPPSCARAGVLLAPMARPSCVPRCPAPLQRRRAAPPLPTTAGSLSAASPADTLARAAPPHRAGDLLTARTDTQQRKFIELLSSPSSTPLARSGAGPCPAGPAALPTPSSPLLDLSLSRPSRPDPRCCGLLGSIRHPFGWIASSHPDPSLSWPSRPDPTFPFFSAAGADTMTGADACAAVGLLGGAP
jgi:hypothetical protein